MSFALNDFVEGMFLKLLDSTESTLPLYSQKDDSFTLSLNKDAIVSIKKDIIMYYKVMDNWEVVEVAAYDLLDKAAAYNIYCAFKEKLGG